MTQEKPRKIVVEVTLPAPVELVWERTQDPVQHVSWDIRFTAIRYLDEVDARGYRVMDYRTNIGFGIEVQGFGHYLQSTPLRRSTFEFDSKDWKSLMTRGRGIWQYEPSSGGTSFRTVYDYDVRHGLAGWVLDRLVFRRLLQLATEWGFETLRLWCAGDESAVARRASRWRFFTWFLARSLGKPPAPGAARSRIGSAGSVE